MTEFINNLITKLSGIIVFQPTKPVSKPQSINRVKR